MNKLKKYLFILLVFSVFIPKTYALTNFETEYFDASVYSTISPYNYLRSYTNVSKVQTGVDEFLDFNQMYVDSNYSRTCDGQSFIYRIDYQLFGGHNQNKTDRDWVNFSKLITADKLSGVPNYVEVIGSIVSVPSWDKINVSTFIKYTWATSDNCQTMDLNLTLDFNDTASDLYFYVPNVQSNYYTIYNASYEVSNEEQAKQLINEYYEKYSITNEKLDSIEQKLIDTNEKLEDIQNELDDLNDNITNSDTTSSQNTANGFFNNFNTEDNGGISAIVTAPLRAINSMVEGTCQPLTATWRGKTISLPCGTEFWDKMAPIRTFLNVIEGGIICYGILVDIYKMINRMKNPEDDRVDVMKL